MRIGLGYDVHRLVRGRPLVLGGITIPYGKGLKGHSDADVLIHAVCDALLGAASLGDIGQHFPDTSPRYRGIKSTKLLARVGELLSRKRFRAVNIDVMVIAEEPKLGTYILRMRHCLGGCLGIPVSRISIKATTNEGLGFIGRKQGIAAGAVCLLSTRKRAR